MKIISKVKDYYDYLVSVYGIDEDIVYDRRDCNILHKIPIEYFSKDILNDDSIKKLKKQFCLCDNGKYKFMKTMVGTIYYFIIEIGYTHYLFSVERYIENNEINIIPQLLEVKKDCKKRSKYPISLIPINTFGGIFKGFELRDYMFKIEKEIYNPIFDGTYISSFINADDIYNDLYNYLISIREKEIIDNRNDVSKLESHGFDKITSFRGKNK